MNFVNNFDHFLVSIYDILIIFVITITNIIIEIMSKIKWSRYDNCRGLILGNESEDIKYDGQKVYWCELKKVWVTKEEYVNKNVDELPNNLDYFTNDGLAGHQNFKYID